MILQGKYILFNEAKLLMGQLDCLGDLLSNMKTFFECWQELSLAVETFNGSHCPTKFRMRHLGVIWQGMRDREVTEGI